MQEQIKARRRGEKGVPTIMIILPRECYTGINRLQVLISIEKEFPGHNVTVSGCGLETACHVSDIGSRAAVWHVLKLLIDDMAIIN